MMRQVDCAGYKPGLSQQAVSVQRSLPNINSVCHFVSLSQPLNQLPGVVFMGPVRRACAFLHGSSLLGFAKRKIVENTAFRRSPWSMR